MTGIFKDDIIRQLKEAANAVETTCHSIPNKLFFLQPAEKWSVAQNISHLTIAAKSTLPAFNLPKFIVRWYAGKPNRTSRTYEELVAKYKLKLEQGGRAGGRFIPKIIIEESGKEKSLNDFSRAMKRLITAIDLKWDDMQLDCYIAPHPLLGKITLRELCYFTIYHTAHHVNSIKKSLK